MFDRFAFVVGEAFQNLRRHPFMTFSAVIVVAISLTILGGIGYLYSETLHYAESVPSRFDMYVVLREGTKGKDISDTAAVIRGMPGVSTVNWIPRDKAWERERQRDPKFTEGLENPLPDAFKVTLKDLGKGEAVASAIRALPAVDPQDGLRYAKDEQLAVHGMLQALQWVGAFGSLLFLTAGILIYNTIRLAAIARKMEVRIMRLVGASRTMVAMPFMLEGMAEGAVGGVVSAFFISAAHLVFTRQFSALKADQLSTAINPNAGAAAAFPTMQAVVYLSVLGMGYGAFCSLLALRTKVDSR